MGANGGHFQKNMASGTVYISDLKDGVKMVWYNAFFNALQQEKIIAVKVEILALDSTSCKVHPDAHGALKKEENNPSENQKAAGIPSFMWYPQMTRSLSKCICPEETVMTHRREEYPSNK